MTVTLILCNSDMVNEMVSVIKEVKLKDIMKFAWKYKSNIFVDGIYSTELGSYI